MDNNIKRNEIMARFTAMKQRKQKIVEELVTDMKSEYEANTGKKANFVFVL